MENQKCYRHFRTGFRFTGGTCNEKITGCWVSNGGQELNKRGVMTSGAANGGCNHRASIGCNQPRCGFKQ
jgi:hypothetical protein